MHGVFSFWEDQCDLIHNVVFYMWRKYCYMNLIGCTLFPELIKFRVTCRIHVVIGLIDMAVIDVFGVINIYFGNRCSLGNGIIRGSRRYYCNQRY